MTLNGSSFEYLQHKKQKIRHRRSSNWGKLFFSQTIELPVRTSFTNFLIAVRTTENFSHDLLVTESFQRLVQTLDKTHEKFYSVLLFSQIHRFTLEPEEIATLEDRVKIIVGRIFGKYLWELLT